MWYVDTTPFKDSLGPFIPDLVYRILSWMEHEERNCIWKWQREGIDVPLRSGTTFGRPKVKNTEESIEETRQKTPLLNVSKGY